MLRQIGRMSPKFHSGILAVKNIHPVASIRGVRAHFFSLARPHASVTLKSGFGMRLCQSPRGSIALGSHRERMRGLGDLVSRGTVREPSADPSQYHSANPGSNGRHHPVTSHFMISSKELGFVACDGGGLTVNNGLLKPAPARLASMPNPR